MANKVFANGREIACKAADGKSTAAFPDVCLSPPSPPAGPVPIPYPNTGMASDTTDGSKQVKISGKEVVLKDKSCFKKSTGDEAATKSLGMGVVTHQIQGKVYFNAWSMDVKVEGENVPRHLDLTTHNHSSFPGDTPPWPYIDKNSVAGESGPCAADIKKEKSACKDFKPHGDKDACEALGTKNKPPSSKGTTRDIAAPIANKLADNAAVDRCLSARRCTLQKYSPSTCCPPQTPHHIVEASSFMEGRSSKTPDMLGTFSNAPTPYSANDAPCVCAEGTSHGMGGTHELMHTFQSHAANQCPAADLPLSSGGSVNARATTYGEAKKNGIDAFKKVFPEGFCAEKCIEAQLDNYHNQCGITNETPCKAIATRQVSNEMIRQAQQEANERFSRVLLTLMG
jgi:hypothetical protein